MLFSQKSTPSLPELIIETLHHKGSTGPSLLESLRKKTRFSKETFYRVLRLLLKEEIVSKHGSLYELNRHWLQRVYRFGKHHIETPTATDTDNILSFKEGDSITYSFKNPNLMGVYWAHSYDLIFEQHNPEVPILIFHPHEWLIYTRKKAESFFLNRFNDDKKLVFFSLSGSTSLDKEFKLSWTSRYRQIATGVHYGLDNRTYINVLGDFIFKVTTSKKFGRDLDTFFKKHERINSENFPLLEKLCSRNDRTKMVFTRSKKEAAAWRKKFKKYFYLPKHEKLF